MAVEIISWSISTKVWYRAGIELATPGYAVRHVSVPDTLWTALGGPQMVFLKDFFEKVDFEKRQQTTNKHENVPEGKELMTNLEEEILDYMQARTCKSKNTKSNTINILFLIKI